MTNFDAPLPGRHLDQGPFSPSARREDRSWHGYDQAARSLCVNAFGEWFSNDFWKTKDDLRRYGKIISLTKPDVIIETGTNTGASASWFAGSTPVHPLVITIDVDESRWVAKADNPNFKGYRLIGDSTSEKTLSIVRKYLDLYRPSRIMVSLDSDHSAEHVRREIELYAPLVTPGCYLVVEDGVLAWLNDAQLRAHGCDYEGTPLDAIERWRNRGWGPFTRDHAIEAIGSVPTMNPAGWWRRDG